MPDVSNGSVQTPSANLQQTRQEYFDTIANSSTKHGFEGEYNSEEYLSQLDEMFHFYFADKRHESCGNPRPEKNRLSDWRMRERMKTFSAALVTCLNIGTDPPDIVKTAPCAKLECWIDPFTLPVTKALEQIGKNLQQQYENLSMRTRYKIYLDPSVEEARKFCTAQRRNAKDERVLFHYNGHGVPKPTQSGEVWVFNKNYTQYIPVSLYDLQLWLGSPCLYVFDCSAAGNILSNFHRFAAQKDEEASRQEREDPNFVGGPSQKECILLGACGPTEILPMNPDLPADLFTCCLTSPIEIAVRWFVLQNPLPSDLTVDMVSKIPGRLQDRRTPLGELNWIFTAITDTIAWNVLPGPLFKRLFRQDLMVAALFRNFLLAERIMRVHQCHPQSFPELPPTHAHSMWDSWDLAVDTCLAQLPALLAEGETYEYQHSSFFTEQLLAFEVWLQTGSASKKAPDQLPIVLQVLLSQVHRLRALILLSKFLDLGPWAVNLALSIGIFPYVLKLLQSPAAELKPVLVFIWARILAVDGSCQSDLLKDNGFSYFVQILSSPTTAAPVPNPKEHRAMCAFILAVFTKNFRQGQMCVLSSQGLMSSCLSYINCQMTPDPLSRQWSALLISNTWLDFPEAKWLGIRERAHEKLVDALSDSVPEVRAAALVAMTTFLGLDITEQVVTIETYMAVASLGLSADGSALVRKELVVFFSALVSRYEKKFTVVAFQSLIDEYDIACGIESGRDEEKVDKDSFHSAVWKTVLMFSVDPFPEVEASAAAVVDQVLTMLIRSSLAERCMTMMNNIYPDEGAAVPSLQRNNMTRGEDISHANDGKRARMTSTLKRTASIAVSLKNFALGYSEHYEGDFHAEPNQPPPADASYVPTSPQTPLLKPYPRGFDPKKRVFEIPLRSTFFEWSCEYFQEPQMKPLEADEPGSLEYNERLWRRSRNEKMIGDTQPLKEFASSHAWSGSQESINNVSQPTRLLFHQFEPHLVAADDKDGLAIWNWELGYRLNVFSNSNPTGSKITDIKFLNEDDIALLMAGSSDGIVRLYRNYEQDDVELVSSWRALTDLLPSNRSSGLVADWQQGRGTLLVGGDVKVIRVWDAPREMCLNDIPARSGSCITSITSDQVAGDVFVAGFGDGAVRVYDRRVPPRDAMVRVWKEHKAWISNVHMQRGGSRELVSGCVSGEVKLWDIRLDHSIRDIQAHSGGLRSLAVHEHAPVIATGSTNHLLKVWNTEGRTLSTLRHYSGFLQQGKTASVSALAFHPHKMVLASSGGCDNHTSIYRSKTD